MFLLYTSLSKESLSKEFLTKTIKKEIKTKYIKLFAASYEMQKTDKSNVGEEFNTVNI